MRELLRELTKHFQVPGIHDDPEIIQSSEPSSHFGSKED